MKCEKCGHDATAPASLVEYPCPTCGAERFKTERRLNGDSWCRFGHKHPTKDFVRPSTQADIVGEFREWLEEAKKNGDARFYNEFKDAEEIIRKWEAK